MLLNLLCERDLVEVVVVIDRLVERLVVLVLDVQLVDRLVHGREVLLLH